MIKNFKQLTNKDAASAGGKGASLGEMTLRLCSGQAPQKCLVPPGFVVLASAFEKFIEETDINVEIDAMWDRFDVTNTEEIERNSEMMQSLIISKDFPKDLGKEILKGFDKLKAKYVAVRSSATAEDSKLDAWAGQLESYLYVDKKGLLKAVQKCWASLFTPRAIFYRLERMGKQKNPPSHKASDGQSKISVAVVVQKMINSDVSGVCFTVHPVTKDKDQMIIEACWGLGEALVQGIITPDSYVIEKSKIKNQNAKSQSKIQNLSPIIDINIGNQEKMTVRGRGGTREVEIKKEPAFAKRFGEARQKLTERQIKELAEICIAIENHYGDPRDIEWALERGRFYIVQSRPITTL